MSDFPVEVVLIALGVYLAFAVVADQLVDNLEKYLAAPLRDAFKGVHSAVEGFLDKRFAPALQSLQDDAVKVGNGLGEAVVPIEGALETPMNFFRKQTDLSLRVLTRNRGDPSQRILGALIYGVAIGFFVYADAALGLNSATAVAGVANIPPPDVPAWLQSLNVPIVIAFMANMLILGVIFADLSHVTDFAPWPRSGKLLASVRVLVILNIMAVVALGLGFMLARVVELAPGISDGGQTAERLNGIAVFSMNAVTAPALVTTLLLWPGVFALFVLWLVLNGALIALTALFRFLARWWQSLWPLAGKAGAMILGWIGAVLAGVIRLMNWGVAAISTLLDLVVGAIGAVILTAIYPARQVWNWLLRFDVIAYTILRRPGRPVQARAADSHEVVRSPESDDEAIAERAASPAVARSSDRSGGAAVADSEQHEAPSAPPSTERPAGESVPRDVESETNDPPDTPGPFKKYTN